MGSLGCRHSFLRKKFECTSWKKWVLSVHQKNNIEPTRFLSKILAWFWASGIWFTGGLWLEAIPTFEGVRGLTIKLMSIVSEEQSQSKEKLLKPAIWPKKKAFLCHIFFLGWTKSKISCLLLGFRSYDH